MSVLAPLIAFVVWGCWAYFSNAQANSALTSALVQGTVSAVMAVVIEVAVLRLYRVIACGKRASVWLIVPPAIMSLLIVLVMTIAHKLVGTQNIITTVVPPSTVGFLYGVWVVIAESRRARH